MTKKEKKNKEKNLTKAKKRYISYKIDNTKTILS